MRNKFLYSVLLAVFSLFFFAMNAFAQIHSQNEIYNKAQAINTLINYDFNTMINKNELIGVRQEQFLMVTLRYKTYGSSAIEDLRRILSSLEKNDDGKVDEQKLFNDADRIIYNFDTETINYLMTLVSIMPTITYQRYLKKFEALYNSLGISATGISLKY